MVQQSSSVSVKRKENERLSTFPISDRLMSALPKDALPKAYKMQKRKKGFDRDCPLGLPVMGELPQIGLLRAKVDLLWDVGIVGHLREFGQLELHSLYIMRGEVTWLPSSSFMDNGMKYACIGLPMLKTPDQLPPVPWDQEGGLLTSPGQVYSGGLSRQMAH